MDHSFTMRSDSKLRVAVVGAGPAGLTTAAALLRHAPRGAVDVTVLDRGRSVLDYPGVEYGLRPRAMRALQRIGLDDVPRQRGHRVSRIEFHEVRRGRRTLVLPVDARRNIGVLRREFLADLAEAVDVPVERDRRVLGVSPGGAGSVRVHLADGADPLEVDLLVAADGSRSAVRAACFPEQAAVHDRGFSIVYALADGRDRPEAALPAGFAATASAGAVRFSRGSRATTAWFPAGDRRLTLALGVDHATRDRLWSEHGVAGTPWADVPGAVRHELARRIAADTPGRDGLLGAALDLVGDWAGPDTYLWEMRDSDPLPHPYSADLPVVLLGDAAHAFLPTIGMGASLAIEDAEALGALVGRHLRTGTGSLREDVLVPFGRARYPVWDDLMGRARAAVVNWLHDGPDRGFVLFPHVPTRLGSATVRAYERLRGRTAS